MTEIARFILALIIAIQSSLSSLMLGLGFAGSNEKSNNNETEIETSNEESQEIYYSTDTVMHETVIFDQLKGEFRSNAGCGPTCTAMLISSETDTSLSKDEAIRTAYNEGFYYSATENFISGRGVMQEDNQKLIQYYGYDSEIDHLWDDPDDVVIEKVNTHLDDGHRIILGHCTNSGALNYVVIYGKYSSDGVCYYDIVDPWGGTSYVWNQFELIDHLEWVNGNDSSTFNGMVKGIQWLI